MHLTDCYLNNVLIPQLKEFDVSDEICSETASNIKNQMLSLLCHWNDEKFRNTVLVPGTEEGIFYKPSSKSDIKRFVVVTVRNSMLETLASDDYKKLGAKRIIEDDEIKLITCEAVKYFSDADMEKAAETADYTNINDIYGGIKSKYTAAWSALDAIGNTKKKSVRYSKVTSAPERELVKLITASKNDIPDSSLNKVVVSGYDEDIDGTLFNILAAAYSEPNFVFFADCFKMISRNANKLFRVIDFILQCGKPIITSNYYITDSCAEIRNPLVRPAHGTNDVIGNLRNLKGVSAKHAKALKEIAKQL